MVIGELNFFSSSQQQIWLPFFMQMRCAGAGHPSEAGGKKKDLSIEKSADLYLQFFIYRIVLDFKLSMRCHLLPNLRSGVPYFLSRREGTPDTIT